MQTTSTDAPQIILVIDDNPVNLGVVVDYLADYGFEVVVARDGESGVRRATFVKPDLILLDVMMPPGIDGFETCRRLKMDEATAEIPVIFMTALADEDSKVTGFDAGGVDYVTKPVQMADVLARVKTHLALRQLQADIQRQNEQLQEEVTERKRTAEALKQANQEIVTLNKRLEAENTRLEAELDIARQMQHLLLPTEAELQRVTDFDMAAFMEPADEVGGDYYDVLQHNGRLKIGIGDVTGHGLLSGLVMLMTQTAVRTLLTSEETDATRFFTILNQTIYDNVQRMQTRKNLSLTLLDYYNGEMRVSGQHEEVIFVEKTGEISLVDTTDLGFPVGMLDQIDKFVKETTLQIQSGAGIVLYTDGITEATNDAGQQYGLTQLCNVVQQNWSQSAEQIKQAIVTDVKQFIGSQKVYDDLTLLVLKRR